MASYIYQNRSHLNRLKLAMTNNPIHFAKMHGLGNDFIVINQIEQMVDLSKLPIKQLANRYTGIGFDQLLLLEKTKQADFFCRIFNADGSEAEQCGNGLRCVARFIYNQHLCSQSNFKIATRAGIFPVNILPDGLVQVSMGIPLLDQQAKEIDIPAYPPLILSILSLGNPHAILKVSSLEKIDLEQLGKTLSTHALFPQGVNVGFMQIINPNLIQLRTYERGSGLTNACGSNACAAVFAGILNGWLNRQVTIEYPYGMLKVEYQEQAQSILMTGPAEYVFSGILP